MEQLWTTLAGVILGLLLVWVVLVIVLWRLRPDDLTLKECLSLLPDLLTLLRRLAIDKNLPWGIRIRLWLLLAYLLSPIDLIPDFIPVLGYADDAVIVAFTLRSVIRSAGPEALESHWSGSEASLSAVRRIARLDTSN